MGAERLVALLSWVPFFLDRLIGGGDGGGLSTTLSPGLRSRVWSPSLDGDLDPLTREWWVGLAYA